MHKISSNAKRIWSNDKPNQYSVCFFRKVFILNEVPETASFFAYAEHRCNIWINGTYIGRAPAYSHPDQAFGYQYDVTTLLRPGKNAIAVSVNAFNFSTHYHVPRHEPGLVAELILDNTSFLTTDASWICSSDTGYKKDSPKRTWAIGPINVIDLKHAPSSNWHSIDYDEKKWTPVTTHDVYVTPESAYTPSLKYQTIEANKTTLYSTSTPPTTTNDFKQYGHHLEQTDYKAAPSHIRICTSKENCINLNSTSKSTGLIVEIDLGANHTGQPFFDITTESTGTIDIAWSEILDDNQHPMFFKHGNIFADRILVTTGNNQYLSPDFSSGRYMSLFLREFQGHIHIHQFGMISSEPDLNFNATFQTPTHTHTQIFDLCKRTLRMGTQEALLDCPSREQATYIGDGHYVAHHIAQATGDIRYWTDLINQQFHRQAPNGLIRSSIYSGRNDTLLDYNLLAIALMRDYLHYTSDIETIRRHLPAAKKCLEFFITHLDDNHVFTWEFEKANHSSPWENKYNPDWPHLNDQTIFIDHPGMGWHCKGEPGINRSGINAAMNALFCITCDALADICHEVGEINDANQLRNIKQQNTKQSINLFLNQDKHLFADGIDNDCLHKQISQQTNTWAMLAGWADHNPLIQDAILELLINPPENAARNTAYFWHFSFPLLYKYDSLSDALKIIDEKWGHMIKRGATTLYETFNGDHFDSHCHPWSASPLPVYLNYILGLPDTHNCPDHITLKPQTNLLSIAEGSVITKQGPIQIKWNNNQIIGSLPTGITASLILPNEKQPIATELSGNWQIKHPAPTTA
ncbi:Bacterial alpha-L-rhamnosidase [Poriferisphaera corsica]|uniref:Bacterial alpha-L-rhamnosidase n=1 Tax=Poriferisphaera corsica TaxID=2528020 RepID=A0A517YYG5_9BACT|nr:alpha-L-rhamnosidase N-terminal domain-containing protein [Poriferisphaera corsica]QDU35264.1 Bacterial alpha-L-rhamnosidase [Poriferisphaera corsica]